jgi:hypothetical protein
MGACAHAPFLLMPEYYLRRNFLFSVLRSYFIIRQSGYYFN